MSNLKRAFVLWVVDVGTWVVDRAIALGRWCERLLDELEDEDQAQVQVTKVHPYDYHNVVVTVNENKYPMVCLYDIELTYCRVSGWELWVQSEKRLLGGEFNGDDFKIQVGDVIILDARRG